MAGRDEQMNGWLVVTTTRGVITVPLSGEDRTDALLERVCRKGGRVERHDPPRLHGDAHEPV